MLFVGSFDLYVKRLGANLSGVVFRSIGLSIFGRGFHVVYVKKMYKMYVPGVPKF
eukprot:SAG11_NODE_21074_length_432_cov_2.846847_1_plen_55_part_00